MPYTFTLPTTSDISYTHFFQSSTHPSLPVTASIHRAAARSVLKTHKRLPTPSQAAHLPKILSALEEYLPYLLALDAGLAGKKINGEEVDVTLHKEVEIEWRTPALAAPTMPGRGATRLKGRGLDYEICFVLSTLAYLSTLLAHSQLRALYAPTTPTQEQRTGIISKSTKHFLQANSTHAYLITRANEVFTLSSSLSSSSFSSSATPAAAAAMETNPLAQEALAELAMAEATLLAVLKDDPYPAIVAQDRNSHDTEWKYKAPEIPRVRAHLFARLCLAAAAHAAKAELLLNSFRSSSSTKTTVMIRQAGGGGYDGNSVRLMKYIHDLGRAARAKAYRLFGIDADIGGEQGQAIAWLRAAKRELGFGILVIGGSSNGGQGTGVGSSGSSSGGGGMKVKGGFAKLKKEWTERREDKRIERGEGWGSDAGRFEEQRIVDMLEKKWNKINDIINTQIIPPLDELVAKTPSGRDIHSPKQLLLPCLDYDILERMRAPPDVDADDDGDDDDDDDVDNESESDITDDDNDDGLDASDNEEDDGGRGGDLDECGENNGKRRIDRGVMLRV